MVGRLKREGAKVIGIDREIRSPDSATIKLDILKSLAEMKKLIDKADIIYHLAAYSSAHMFKEFIHPYQYNLELLARVLDCAARSKQTKRLVFPSSSTVYTGTNFPWREDVISQIPVNWYSASKITGEMLCKYYSNHTNLETVVVRIFCGYGLGEEHKGIYASPISLFVNSAVNGRAPQVWGSGRQERDFIYIDDIIDGLILAGTQPVNNDVFNLGSGRSNSFIEVISMINDLLGTDVKPKFTKPSLSSYIDKTLADTRKSYKILGFKAKTGLKDGILRTGRHYMKLKRNSKS